jgi:agmatinase
MALIERSGGRQVAFTDFAVSAHQHAGKPLSHLIDRIIGELPDDVYVSFDIDGLDPSLCPNTGTPVPGGLSFQAATALLAAIRASGRRLVGFDLVEVASSPDLMEQWDGNVGARLLYKLCGHALAGTRGHLRRA